MKRFIQGLLHKKNLKRGIFVCLALLVLPYLGFDIAYAETSVVNDFTMGMAQICAIIIEICCYFALITIGTIGKFMGNDFIAGPQMIDIIGPMWVLVRNLVNISAIVIILFIALSNLFRFGEGEWTIKDKLPLLILALIAVNFSMVMIRVALDMVYVGTVSIYTISDGALRNVAIRNGAGDDATGSLKEILLDSGRCLPNDETCKKTKDGSIGDAENFIVALNRILCSPLPNPDGSSPPDPDEGNCFLYINSKNLPDTSPQRAARIGQPGENIFAAFSVYVMYLEMLPALESGIGSNGGKINVEEVVDATIFGAIMGILYSFGFLAILVTLIARVVFMWFILILSPAIIGAQILGINMGGTWDRMVKNLIMPLKIGGVLAISFLMIAQAVSIAGPDTIANQGAVVLGPSVSKMGIDIFAIVWKIMTIFVFWTGLWWALEGNEAEFVTNKIKGGAEALGTTALKGASALPILPIPGGNGEKMGVGALGSIHKMIDNKIAASMQEDNDALGAKLGLLDPNDTKAMKDFVDGLDRNSDTNKAIGQDLNIVHEDKAKEALIKKAKDEGMTGKDLDNFEAKIKTLNKSMTSEKKAEVIAEAFDGEAGVTKAKIMAEHKAKIDAQNKNNNNQEAPSTLRTVDPNNETIIMAESENKNTTVNQKNRRLRASKDNNDNTIIVDIADLDQNEAQTLAQEYEKDPNKKVILLDTVGLNYTKDQVQDFEIKSNGGKFALTNSTNNWTTVDP